MTPNPSLLEREENVLSSVIHHYVATARPVGSRLISGELEVSPATVRHILMDLEKKGLLTHPHTSAGRVPMDQGYRFYVDRLMRARTLTLREKQRIEQEYQEAKSEVETLLRHTARVLSAMTQLAGLAVFRLPREISMDHFKIVGLDSRRILVILSLGEGLFKEEVVFLESPMAQGEMSRITRLLNSRFAGQSLSQVRESLLREVESARAARLNILETALRLIDGALQFDPDEIHLEGAATLAEQPEFRDYQMMEQVVRLVEEKEPLARMLGRQWTQPGLSVDIGREFPQAALRAFSFVHIPYYYRGQVVGALGVLGPTRMAYDYVAGVVQHLSRQLEATLSQREGESESPLSKTRKTQDTEAKK